jgi:ribonuclease Z
MTFREAATLAREAGVKRLWVTHFSPAVEKPEQFQGNATDVFPSAVVARDGLTLGLTFADGPTP